MILLCAQYNQITEISGSHWNVSSDSEINSILCVFNLKLCYKSTQITFHFNKSTDSLEEALLNNLNVIRARLWDVSCFEFWQTSQTISNLNTVLLVAYKILISFISSGLPKHFSSLQNKNDITYLGFWLSYKMTILLLIRLMDYCDQIFLFFWIFPVIVLIVVISNDANDQALLYWTQILWPVVRVTSVGWGPCQLCLTSWCLTSPSASAPGPWSAAVTRPR